MRLPMYISFSYHIGCGAALSVTIAGSYKNPLKLEYNEQRKTKLEWKQWEQ